MIKMLIFVMCRAKILAEDACLKYDLKIYKNKISLLYIYAIIYKIRIKIKLFLEAKKTDFYLMYYDKTLKTHYSEEGVAYGDIKLGQEKEFPEGRLRLYIDNLRELMSIRDQDSFLDAGCGPGQNIHVLRKEFPNSKIIGVDINKNAIELAKKLYCNDEKINFFVGDLGQDFLFSNCSVDYVLMSHVIGFMVKESTSETRAMRHRMIKNMFLCAKKGVIVLDGMNSISSKFSVEPEQKTRCRVYDDVLRYFDDFDGIGPFVLKSSEGIAIAFFKNITTEGNA